MSLWCYNDIWHLSTNGTINAFQAPLGDTGKTFGDYFIDCLFESARGKEILKELNPLYCYTFEMVGPLNRVVIPYSEPKLYAIGQRNMVTMEEIFYNGPVGFEYNIWLPKYYGYENLDEVIKQASLMSKDEEGFVVRDAQFNRIKVKSPEYLMAARLHNNGVITDKRIIEIIQTEKVDDFIAYCPMYEARLREMQDKITKVLWSAFHELDYAIDQGYFYQSRAEYAKAIKDCKYKHFLFCMYDGKYNNVKDYIYSMRPEHLLKMIESL